MILCPVLNFYFYLSRNDSSNSKKNSVCFSVRYCVQLSIQQISNIGATKKKIFSSNSDIQHTDLPLSSLDLSYDGSQSPGSSNLSSQSRSKRMRTSFKHHQLRTMKSYFAINQNPDAKDLKQLAQKTGLSKRVLQVK